jgi:opacity protein-like surface antigen
VRWAWAFLVGAALLLPSESAAQRRTREGIFSMPFQVGPRTGRNFESDSWMVGGQLSASLGKTFELRPSGDMYLKRGEKMAWQLNGDAAIRFGDEGLVYAGGGVAWLHPPDVDAQTGYNVFLGLNSAAPWEKARGFLEGRWTRVNDNTAFQLVFGVLYRL